jgi:diaminopimelate decarboxylase
MMDFSLETVRKLEAEFENPLYVLDESAFVQNYREFETTLQQQYPKYQLSYSFKTNYTPYICSLVKNLGGYAEVVSGFEYDIARRVGFTSSNIIFNGPNKGEDGLKALLDGCILNVDNLDELDAVCRRAKQFPAVSFEIGLRINLDVGQGFLSRFGMDPEDLTKAFAIVKAVPNLRIVGLHCHISRCRGKDAWQRRSEIMLDLSDRYFPDDPPKYIDLGSGMFGKMDPDFRAQFDSVPSYADYAAVTAKLVADHYSRFEEDRKPLLFTEPGTTLINKYIDFLGRIDVIKTIKGKDFAILNCSVHNLGEACTLKTLPMKVISAGGRSEYFENADLVGYTCLEQDVLYQRYTGFLGLGDYVQFGNVGGYSTVYKPPFIWPNCAMLVKQENGEYREIKRAESYDDLLGTYVF